MKYDVHPEVRELMYEQCNRLEKLIEETRTFLKKHAGCSCSLCAPLRASLPGHVQVLKEAKKFLDAEPEPA